MASAWAISAPTASPISSLKYGNCHLSGASMTPSSDTNSDAITFLTSILLSQLTPGHGCLVPASRPLLAPGDGVAVVAEPTLEACRRAHLPTPDREGVLTYLPHVLEGNPPEGLRPLVAEEVGPQVVVLLVVADVLGAHNPAADVVDVDMLDEVEATFHPLKGGPPMNLSVGAGLAALQLPSADRDVQALQRGIRSRLPIVGLSIVGVVVICHNGSSFRLLRRSPPERRQPPAAGGDERREEPHHQRD